MSSTLKAERPPSRFYRCRERARSTPGLCQAYKVGVFLLGLAFIAAGLALAVLPGPLTIPPVLIGLYVWSTEFQWASSLLERFKVRARDAWESAKRRPVISSFVTLGGLLAAAGAIWAVSHYSLVERGRELVGL